MRGASRGGRGAVGVVLRGRISPQQRFKPRLLEVNAVRQGAGEAALPHQVKGHAIGE